jgi:dCTP diphosphatase
MSHDAEIETLTTEIRNFAKSRDWEKFHTPKNLAMAIAGEAGELAAEFQWLTPEDSLFEYLTSEKLRDIRLELADVQIYLLRLSDVLNIDIPDAVREKMKINENRF